MAGTGRADELYRRIEGAAYADGRELSDLRDSLAREPLEPGERDELAGLCDVYLAEMAQTGFEGPDPNGGTDGTV